MDGKDGSYSKTLKMLIITKYENPKEFGLICLFSIAPEIIRYNTFILTFYVSCIIT